MNRQNVKMTLITKHLRIKTTEDYRSTLELQAKRT